MRGLTPLPGVQDFPAIRDDRIYVPYALEITPPRDPFLVKLFFAKRAAPAAAVELVVAYREHIARLLEEWELQERERAKENADAIELIVLRFALVRARATLAWCDETLEVLREASS